MGFPSRDGAGNSSSEARTARLHHSNGSYSSWPGEVRISIQELGPAVPRAQVMLRTALGLLGSRGQAKSKVRMGAIFWILRLVINVDMFCFEEGE